MNAHGSWPNLALMLGMEKDASLTQQFFEFVRRYRLFPGKMLRVRAMRFIAPTGIRTFGS
jgi:hypothetical protein